MQRCALLVLALLVAGCTGTSPNPGSPEAPSGVIGPPALRVGDEITYAAEAVSMHVEILPILQVRDFTGAIHDALPWRITIDEEGGSAAFTALIDPNTHHIIGHVRDCARTTKCIAYEWSQQSKGLPAPLGIGWDVNATLGPVTGGYNGVDSWTFDTKRVATCLTISANADAPGVWLIPIALLPADSFVLCEDAAAPKEVTLAGTRFVLTSHTTGSGPPVLQSRTEAASVFDGRVIHGAKGGNGHHYPERDSTRDPLPLVRAIQVARQDERVQEFIEAHPDFQVLFTQTTGNGSASVPAANVTFSESPRRTVILAGSSGEGIRVDVRDTQVLGMPPDGAVDSVERLTGVPVIPPSVPIVDMADAIDFAIALMPNWTFGGTYGTRSAAPPGLEPAQAVVMDGYTYVVRLDGPSVGPGLLIVYEVWIDGATGTIVRYFGDSGITEHIPAHLFRAP